MEDSLPIETGLFSRERNELFLNIISGDKNVFYENIQYKGQWTDKDKCL